MRRFSQIFTSSSAILLASVLTACSTTQVLHKDVDDPNIITWDRSVSNSNLTIHQLWAKPMKPGPHPTLIIHPGIRETASDLKGLTIDLAKHGYLAVAISYERNINGKLETTPFSLRDMTDFEFVLRTIIHNPLVDKSNIGAIGFSLGGANSLLLAAYSNRIKVVATYYPMTDFQDWFDNFDKPLMWRLASLNIKYKLAREFSEDTEQTRRKILESYSAINYARQLDMPILIFHGKDDNIAPIYHSQNMIDKLRHNGNSEAKLRIVENAGHAYNFALTQQSETSWNDLLIWLDKHMKT
jgi:dipeptidyl aminopeptidase/acylaminoacyl peptidase